MADVKPYIVHNFTVVGNTLDEEFDPITDYEGNLMNLLGATAELVIYSIYGTEVARLTTAAGELTLAMGQMTWKKDLPTLSVGEYNYVFRLEEGGVMVPRMKGTIIKESI